MSLVLSLASFSLCTGFVEAELLGEFVEDMGGRDKIDAFVLLDPVLYRLKGSLVILELPLGLVGFPCYLLRPSLGSLL